MLVHQRVFNIIFKSSIVVDCSMTSGGTWPPWPGNHGISCEILGVHPGQSIGNKLKEQHMRYPLVNSQFANLNMAQST